MEAQECRIKAQKRIVGPIGGSTGADAGALNQIVKSEEWLVGSQI